MNASDKLQSNMDVYTCLKSVIPDMSNSSISILFEMVLPSLVSGLLFGGIPPYIIHISNLNFENEKGKMGHLCMRAEPSVY